MSTQESVAALKTALQTPSEDIAKSFTQPGSATTGLQGYDLEGPAKQFTPIMTPLRNQIPRDVAGFGTQANWKLVTGINVNNMGVGVAEGRRGASLATSTAEAFAAFRSIGIEDDVTFEADLAAKGFDDLKARAVQGTLQSLMIGEELLLLGGNTSVNMGVTPTPALTASAGGALPATALSVICVALGFEASQNLLGRNNGAVGQSLNIATAVIPQVVNRANNDGSTSTYGAGTGQKSAAASVTPAASGKVTAVSAPVANAYGYAWFWGAAGAETLGAVTTVSAVVISAAATGTQLASSLTASDNSTNSLVFDGLLTQIQKAGSGAYVKALDGQSKLTSDGGGSVVEILNAFDAFWNLYRLSPDEIYVHSQELSSINKIVIANGGAPLIRLNDQSGSAATIVAGRTVGTILNPITNTMVEVKIHPNAPAGTILFYSKSIPYKLSGVSDILKVKLRRDYHAIEWPLRTRKYEYGVYSDEVLQNYFPPAFGVITNIAK